MRKRQHNDLIGQKFGKLTVIAMGERYFSPSGSSAITWDCLCECGNIRKNIIGARLKNGTVRDCGCSHSNKIIVHGEYAEIQCGNVLVLIDTDDISKIRKRRWYVTKNGYVASIDNSRYLHRVLTECPDDMIVDHINHNKLDNRKSNLRVCNYSINAINAQHKVSNTGEFGICRNKRGYYLIEIDKKYIGCTKDLNVAVKMRDEALMNSNAKKYNEYLKNAGRNYL